MRLGIIIALSIMFLFPIAFNDSFGLRQSGGIVEMEISPGESKSFEWPLAPSENEGDIRLEMGAYGWGSEFISYPKSLSISSVCSSVVSTSLL